LRQFVQLLQEQTQTTSRSFR